MILFGQGKHQKRSATNHNLVLQHKVIAGDKEETKRILSKALSRCTAEGTSISYEEVR